MTDRVPTAAEIAPMVEALNHYHRTNSDPDPEAYRWVHRHWTLDHSGWRLIQRILDGFALAHPNGLRVIVSGSIEADGHPWLHVSYSRRDRLPSHGDTLSVKALILGPHRYAYAVYPPADRYVNIHPYVLHLWSPYGPNPVPEFSGMVAGRRTI